MKKTVSLILGLALALTMVATAFAADFDKTNEITVISREASSGTRSAFSELLKIVVKKDDGTTEDQLFAEAVLVNSTDEVSAKVEVDPYAIGYTSLGSVTDKVKALPVDDIEATVENVKAGTYKIARPFILALPLTSDNALAKDFFAFITSKQGQEIVVGNGFIESVEEAPEYAATDLSGKLTFSGSTSVEKVIEKLKEAYTALNPKVNIEITYNGSSAGIKDVTEGKVDVGMSSRELTEEELKVLAPTIFAHDGIAVVVNVANDITGLTSEQITSIFTGATRTWDAVAPAK